MTPESSSAAPRDTTQADSLPSPSRRAALRLGAAWAVLLTAGGLGVAFMPVLLTRAPLVLLALSPLGRHLLLVAPHVDIFGFVLVASLRREAFSTLWYFMGVIYGERGIRWFEGRYKRMGRFVRGAERLFMRASMPLLSVAPNPLFCLLAGTSGMRLRVFLPLSLLGHALWIALTYKVGEALVDWITPITRWIESHVLVLTLVSMGLVGLGQAFRRLRGKSRFGDA